MEPVRSATPAATCPPPAAPGPPQPRLARLLFLAAFCCSPVAAEPLEDPLATDRPDLTEAGSVVGPNRFQIETAVLVERSRRGRVDDRVLFTPTLLRAGIDERWELRLETDGFSRQRVAGPAGAVNRTTGYSVLAPGFKYRLREGRDGEVLQGMVLLTHFNAPSGSGAFRAEKLTGDTKLAMDFDLGGTWSFGSNVGLAFDEDDRGEVFTAGLFTATLGYGITERWRSFIELAFLGPEDSRGTRSALIFDGGMTYLFDANNQLDFALGTGLSGRTTPDIYWTVGFSRRF